MSEARRATLMPFSGEKPSVTADERKRIAAPCIRLTFVLPESNEGTCPVFNYKEELAVVKKRDKTKQQNGKTIANGMDPFDEDDDDVKRIAMEMEAKYGSGPPTKKKRKGRRDDYADIGMGYDESDSFIDNTDGYDEIIPQNVTTLHGGFYINCGALEFKADDAMSSDESSSSSSSSSSDESDDKRLEVSNRKRILDTSSEGEPEKDREKDEGNELIKDKNREHIEKVRPDTVTNGLPLKKKKEATNSIEKAVDKLPSMKKSNCLPSDEMKKKTVKDLLKEKRDETGANGAAVLSSQPKQTISDTLKRSLSDVIESVVASSDTDKKGENSESCVYLTSIKSPAHVPSSEGENSLDSIEKLDIVHLPENLPTNISDIIKRLKDSVQRNKENNKDVFSGSVNSLLITFERKSKVLGKQSRSRIYQYIASIMRIKKEILCSHAKTIVMEEDSKRLSTLLTDLKSKVLIAMPQLMETYEQETLRVTHLKTVESEENKNMRMPKRKFPWNEEMRRMLREIIIIKKRLLIYEGKTKETIEIHLNLFIKSDIHVLWPDGWMTMAALFKLCNSFEKKQPAINSTTIELNTNSGISLPYSVSNTIVDPVKNNILKAREKKEKSKEINILPIKAITSKDIQTFTNNSVSITPLALSDNIKTMTNIKANTEIPGSSIPKQLSVAHRSTIQARNILKVDKHDVDQAAILDRQTKFVNLSHNENIPENLTKKPSIDYNIESIISKKPDVFVRRNSEILIPKEENIGNKGTSIQSVGADSSKIPIENFMPRPLTDVKSEGGVIVLDDTYDDELSDGNTSRIPGEMRRRPGPKCKTKYCDSSTIKSVKCASNSLTSSSSDKKPTIKLDGFKDKRDPKNDGDDILQLMENLKELNKMSTPAKCVDTSPSSAVSVIAYNKNFSLSPTTTGSSKYSEQLKSPTDFSPGLTFHDVYQRQFLNELKTGPAASSTSPTTATKNYNSVHTTSTSNTSQDKYYNSNNNYTSAGQGTKLKNLFPHTGSCNLMDDMLANFITEYAHPKAASHKQKPTSK